MRKEEINFRILSADSTDPEEYHAYKKATMDLTRYLKQVKIDHFAILASTMAFELNKTELSIETLRELMPKMEDKIIELILKMRKSSQ